MTTINTINSQTNPLEAVFHTLLGGKIIIRLTIDRGPGHRFGDVLDGAGSVIGSAHDSPYCGRGFAIQTRPFGGFVPFDQIVFVDESFPLFPGTTKE